MKTSKNFKNFLKMPKMNFLLLMALCFIQFPLTAQFDFVQHPVDSYFYQGNDVIVEDLDRDGDPDIIATGGNSSSNGELAWWKNNSFGEFEKISIQTGLIGVRSVRAADINHDDHTDLVVALWKTNQVLWFENDGAEVFSEHFIDLSFAGAHTIDIKDINEDGNPDVLCSGFDYYGHHGEIAWWEHDGQNPPGWTKHLVYEDFQQSTFVLGADLDNDDDLDILACGEANGDIIWWENENNLFPVEHVIDASISGIHTLQVKDVDLDGDLDILAAACLGSRVVWYENNGNKTFIKHDLGYWAGALWLDAADLDNDGDIDLFGGAQGASKLACWENDGMQNFTKIEIDGTFTQTFCVVPVNDGQ